MNAAALPGVGVVADLDAPAASHLPFDGDSVDEFLLPHLVQRLHHPLPLMQELYRIARPGAVAVVRVPYGSSGEAFEDPTHVRPYFPNSFGYFSQPFHWRGDNGYCGDRQPRKITLVVSKTRFSGLEAAAIFEQVMANRNTVLEMIVEPIAVKPARPALRELQAAAHIEILLA